MHATPSSPQRAVAPAAQKVKLDDLSLRRGELLGVGLMRVRARRARIGCAGTRSVDMRVQVVGERIDSAMKELRSAAGKSPEKLDDCVHEVSQ